MEEELKTNTRGQIEEEVSRVYNELDELLSITDKFEIRLEPVILISTEGLELNPVESKIAQKELVPLASSINDLYKQLVVIRTKLTDLLYRIEL